MAESAQGSSHHGNVVAVHGSVVDVRFENQVPPVNTILRTGNDNEVAIEVQGQLDRQSARGVALTPTQGLARGMKVENTGEPLKAPVGKNILSRMIREYLVVSLFKACAESLASENASRLAAMQRAERNINERVDELRTAFNQNRQSSIDEELFDVISGFEALSPDSH